jgi:hypothetical protein
MIQQRAKKAHRRMTMTMRFNEENGAVTGSADSVTEAAAAKKPKAKKTAAKKAKVAKKAKAKKPVAKKAKGKKAGAAKGPREGSVSWMIVEGIKAGKKRDQIVKEISKKFPDSKFADGEGPAFFSWYRWNAVRKGWLTQAQADKTAAGE